MILRLFLSALLLITASYAQAQDEPCLQTHAAQDKKFHPGQVWAYNTRPGEPDSTITILKVETGQKIGEIIHVRIDNIRLRNCTGGPEPKVLEHAPFTREAIEKSVTKLLKDDGVVPDFQHGYDQWKKACGGVYTLTVAEAVQVDETTFQHGLGCSDEQAAGSSH